MKEHNISLIPVNSMYKDDSNPMMTGNLLKYNTAPGTKCIYFRDPLESWFRCKAVSESPFLEVPIYDLLPGDIITVTFEMLKISNQAPTYFGCNYSTINNGNTSALDSIYIDEKMIDTYFKEFEIPFVVPSSQASANGLLLTLRSYNTTHTACEFIIRNININIKTNNNKFKVNDNYEVYENHKDFIKSLKYVSSSGIARTFRDVIPIFEANKISITSNVIRFNTSDTIGKWKGLVSFLSSSKYDHPSLVYIEYKYSPGGSVGQYAQGADNSDTWNYTEELSLGMLPEASDWSNHITVKKGFYQDNRRTQFINIGRVGAEVNIEIRKIIFAHPRYDAQRYYKPNDHFELFKDFSYITT